MLEVCVILWNFCKTFSEEPEEKLFPPEFIKVPENVTVREHDQAKFIVKVIGMPKPTGTETIIY